ncbi:MAG: cytochrome bd ubiquinol oxidase subunit [Miltoncostaeaceae bacterium]|nr:cytochrome bd ubiquinol oxidase subunit [Miltoncostaeaceae bacterium]
MTLADLCAILIVLGLTAYAVLAGADFGAGFWELGAGRGPTGRRARALIESAMGPVWEANHVWLIFVLVVFWTCFPVAFGSVASTLAVPLFLAAVGIIFRGSTFAFRGAGGPRARPLLGALFVASSLLTPFFLGAAVGAVAAGRVPVGNAAGDPIGSWWNPTGALVGALAVLTGVYLAAVYLAADARRAGATDLAEAFRRRALIAGAVTGALAMGGLLVLRDDSRHLYDGLTGDGLPLVVLSAVAGVATMTLLWRRAYGPARAAAAAAVAAVIWGWAWSQRPDLLPGELTIGDAAAGRPTLVAVLVGALVGGAIVAASLAFLFRLVLSGRLDKELPPRADAGSPVP